MVYLYQFINNDHTHLIKQCTTHLFRFKKQNTRANGQFVYIYLYESRRPASKTTFRHSAHTTCFHQRNEAIFNEMIQALLKQCVCLFYLLLKEFASFVDQFFFLTFEM